MLAMQSNALTNSGNSPPFLQFKRWPILNEVLGGFRTAEITVLSGATGVGKTTFLCEYTIDLAKQGVRLKAPHSTSTLLIATGAHALL